MCSPACDICKHILFFPFRSACCGTNPCSPGDWTKYRKEMSRTRQGGTSDTGPYPKRFESDCLEPDFSNLSVVWIPWHWFCRTLYIAYYTYRLVISESSTNTSALHVQLASMQIGPRTSNRPSCHWAAFAQAVCLRKEHGKSHSVPLGHLAPGRALHPETSWVIDMYHVTFNTCHAKARTKLEGPVSSNS